MKVREVMSGNVQSVQNTDSVRQAAEIMKRMNIGVVPVLKGNDTIGILTDRDITVRLVAVGRDPETTRVGEVMTGDILTCREDQDIEEAAEIMENHQVRRLLVQNAQGRTVGILSLGDLAFEIGEGKIGEVLRRISEPAQPVR